MKKGLAEWITGLVFAGIYLTQSCETTNQLVSYKNMAREYRIELSNCREAMEQQKAKLDSTYQVKEDSLKRIYENKLEEITRREN